MAIQANSPKAKNNDDDDTEKETVFEVDTKYTLIEQIGKGAYGVVCSALNTETNEKVAIKKITEALEKNIHALDENMDALQTLREMTLLRNIKHQNVIALKDIMLPVDCNNTDVYLVYELMDSDLNRLIKCKRKLPADQIKYLFFQFLQGLEYLHSANVLHRDLKPDNLFINAESELKIGDFGLATTFNGREDEVLEDYVVTRWYRAPELLVGRKNYGCAVDVWSAGCIFAELLGGKPIFPGLNWCDQLVRILDVLGTLHEDDLDFIHCPAVRNLIDELPYSRGKFFSDLYPNADDLATDLLEKLLEFSPKYRITVTQALQHPYFSGEYEYDPADNPPANKPLNLNLNLNLPNDMMQISNIKELMRRELRHYHHSEAGVQQTNRKRKRQIWNVTESSLTMN